MCFSQNSQKVDLNRLCDRLYNFSQDFRFITAQKQQVKVTNDLGIRQWTNICAWPNRPYCSSQYFTTESSRQHWYKRKMHCAGLTSHLLIYKLSHGLPL